MLLCNDIYVLVFTLKYKYQSNFDNGGYYDKE